MEMRFLPGGEVRAIWDDTLDLRPLGTIPQRASRIEVIQEGPHRGKFAVDFSLLADALNDDRFRVCLTQVYSNYRHAVEAEIAWLMENWILG